MFTSKCFCPNDDDERVDLIRAYLEVMMILGDDNDDDEEVDLIRTYLEVRLDGGVLVAYQLPQSRSISLSR